jgi:hypothetical protein
MKLSNFIKGQWKMLTATILSLGIVGGAFASGYKALSKWDNLSIKVGFNEESIVQQRVDWLEQRVYEIMDRDLEGKLGPQDQSKLIRLERELEKQEKKLERIQRNK